MMNYCNTLEPGIIVCEKKHNQSNMKIPKIIHQIASSDQSSYQKVFGLLSETWKNCNLDWQYISWDDHKIDVFIEKYYPQYKEKFDYLFNDIQQQDIIRYLILYKMGGLYVDSDYECLENIDPLLKRNCCFACQTECPLSPDSKVKNVYLDNTFIASTKEHSFLAYIIEHIFQSDLFFLSGEELELKHVLNTTGAVMVSDLYDDYTNKNSIYLIPSQYISPFSELELKVIRRGIVKEEWSVRLQGAYSVRYFLVHS